MCSFEAWNIIQVVIIVIIIISALYLTPRGDPSHPIPSHW